MPLKVDCHGLPVPVDVPVLGRRVIVPVVVRGPVWVLLEGTVEMDVIADVSIGRVASVRTVVEVTVPGTVVVDTVCDPSSTDG